MKNIYDINREDLIDFMVEKLRRSRGIPITTKEITEEYFGKPNRYDYRDLFFFGIASQIVGHAWKHVKRRTGLDIYRIKKNGRNGIMVIEEEGDFNEVIVRKRRHIKDLNDEINQLEIDKISDRYRNKVESFFKMKVDIETFNNIARERLRINTKGKLKPKS